MASDYDHLEEVKRLREAFKRDRGAWILEAARGQENGDAAKRLDATMKRLREVDTELISEMNRLTEQAHSAGRHIGDPRSPEAAITGSLREMIGLGRIGYEANPDAEVETLGEILRLGEQEIRRQVDEDTSGDMPGQPGDK